MKEKDDVMYVNSLHWGYNNVPLFENFSLHIPSHKFISIIGPNGSGKTTLLKHLLRVLPIEKNVLFYPKGDAVLYSQKEIAHLASYVPQTSKVEYDFTLFECVAMARYSYHNRFSLLSSEDTDIIKGAIETVGLTQFSTRYATDLSGGEYQRMLIARALAQNAQVLLLDEPVSHLDIHHQVEILNLLRDLVDTKQVSVVSVLHDLNAVSAYSDEVILLNQGDIVSSGKVEEVLIKEHIEKVYRVSLEFSTHPVTKKIIIHPKWGL
ncbi:MAG: ABC transporter ATP-binding protein [Spirochaetia bacterium]|nr:ABC transporter ATP-binding protein [Spirochaetia bacterium]